MFKAYNSQMGVMVAVYRVPFQNKKWWYGFFTWSLIVSAVNALRQRMKAKGEQEPFLDFLHELIIEMLKTHRCSPISRSSVCRLEPEPGLTYRIHHWPAHTGIGKKGQFHSLNCKLLLTKKRKKNLYV